MSSQTQPKTTEVETVSIDELRETDGARLTEIDPDHVSDLQDSIEREGLIEPIVVTPSSTNEYAYDIVDGRHRKRALEELGVQNIAVYAMPGDRDYAVPTREAEVDVEIQSMAANVLRKEQTQAEEARFLNDNIEERIISEFTDEERKQLGNNSNKSYADTRVTPLQLADHLENVENGKVDWKFSDEHYYELRRLLSAADCAPKTASEHLRFYTDSPQDIVDAWKQDDITKGFVKHLRQIDQDDLRTHALEKSKASSDDGYSTRDVETVKKTANYDAPEVHEKLVSGKVSDLDNAVEQAKKEENLEGGPEDKPPEDEPDDVDEDEFETFKQQLDDDGHWEKVQMVADWMDSSPTEIAKDCYRMNSVGEAYQQALEEKIDRIEVKKRERQRLRADRVNSYTFENTPFEGCDENGSTVHKEAPVVLDEAGHTLDDTDEFRLDDFEVAVFFHDNRQMGLEVPDSVPHEELPGFFHLMFFSPPYFDQSGTMPIDQWLPKGTDSITDEETLDATYENYLDWLLERIEVFAQKVKPGRALIINVSDTSTSNLDALDEARFGNAPKKRYDIPSDLSARIRRDVKALRYDSTIQWVRQQTTSQRGGQYWSRSSDAIESGRRGYPLYYYPQDATEELLIFRKEGKPDHEDTISEAASRFDSEFKNGASFRNKVQFDSPSSPFDDCIDELSGEFDDPRKNVWKIAPQTEDWAHDAAFPRKLAHLVIQLFTLPGERIADPFGGYATTLRDVQAVNAKQPDLPSRQGFAWEDFGSEQVGQDDYRKKVHDVLAKTGLAGFGQPLSGFS